MQKRSRRLGLMDPAPDFQGQVLESVKPFTYINSGEITATKHGIPVVAPDFKGQVEDVFIAVGGCGRDDSNALSIEADVKIGGTSVCSTKPKISGKNGAASTSRHSFASGEGVVQGVVDEDNNGFDPGDMIMLNLDLTRTATPTTEIQNVIITVALTTE